MMRTAILALALAACAPDAPSPSEPAFTTVVDCGSNPHWPVDHSEGVMKTRMVEERIGEYLGPVDWSYDFASHDWSDRRGGINPHRITEQVERLRAIADGLDHGQGWEATTDGGWPRVGWKRVIRVGMYDGWPHWRPVPSVQIAGVLGSEWHQFYAIADAYRRP